ncbi:hypothetical protein BASA81_018244 [Batrachochytrium salamandrivorans]|nr:hypothetical protein BASA81_018244 [Batrachochytrium salamandrivorans]
MSRLSIVTADGRRAGIVNDEGKVTSSRSASWKTINDLREKKKWKKGLSPEEILLVEYLERLGIADLVQDDKYSSLAEVGGLFKKAQLIELDELLPAGQKERRGAVRAYEEEYFDNFEKQGSSYSLRPLEDQEESGDDGGGDGDDDDASSGEESEELPVTAAKEGESDIQPDSEPKSQEEEDREDYVEGEEAKEKQSELRRAARELQGSKRSSTECAKRQLLVSTANNPS